MSDSLTWGIAAVAAQEGIKFLYGQMAELLKRARERQASSEPALAASPGNDEVVVAAPPTAGFEHPPAELRLPVASVIGNEEILEAVLAQVDAFLVASKAGRVADEKSMQAVRYLRTLVESISGQRLTFVGEAPDGRAIIRVESVIQEIGEKGEFTGVEVKRGNQKSADIRIDIGRMYGVTTVYKET